MRLKERKDNWRSQAIVKRDFKHDHSEPTPRFRSRKDTGKWCKGMIDMKHELHWGKEAWIFRVTI